MRLALFPVALLAVVAAAHAADSPASAVPGAERRVELLDMVRQDCGACHGLTLKGGLGPSLEPASLAARDVEQLEYVILNGRRGTPMPPWRGLLRESEAKWIAEQLKRGLPK
jgi:cytochrome c55X